LPRATLVVLDHVNHIPQVEKPQEVADIIAEFAGSLGGREAPLPQALLRRTHCSTGGTQQKMLAFSTRTLLYKQNTNFIDGSEVRASGTVFFLCPVGWGTNAKEE
jgi:hypothetical protein